jgi:hypothetical protein
MLQSSQPYKHSNNVKEHSWETEHGSTIPQASTTANELRQITKEAILCKTYEVIAKTM